MGWSKEERAEYMRNWKANNKDKVKEHRRRAYEKSILSGKYEYVPQDKEKAKEYNRRWREKNRDKYNAYQREYQRKLRLKNSIDKLKIV